ncbi:MAG: sigma-70 family RNA polymerase sigma factor [Phycisphaerales bacterium]|nr:sigma-70 family RNA polymerase sigma factor [Phycisphaerales bacterium]
MSAGASENHIDATAAEATQLLARISGGDPAAADALLPMVYAELRARAGAYFRGQPANHTLQPTALVHEAYLRLVRAPDANWQNRAHFCAVAATAMRQILVNHAQRRAAAQRARNEREAAVTALLTPSNNSAIDLLALEEALNRLGELDARQARLVELRFFGGMTNEEVASILEVSTSTVEKEWRRVRAWLIAELRDEGVA